MITIPAGLLFGLLIALAITFARVRRADHVHTFDDIEYLGAPVIGDGVDPGQDAADRSPSSVARMAGVVLNRRAEAPATIAVSAVGTSVPIEAFCQDLAKVLSSGDQSVLLIDAASTTPSKLPGLSEALKDSLSEALNGKGDHGNANAAVTTLPVGKDPNGGAELVASSRMGDLLEDAQSSFRWALVQSPDAEHAAGRAAVGACHYWILVAEMGGTTRADLARGLGWAKVTGTQPLGVVVLARHVARRRGRFAWWPRRKHR